MEAIIVQAIFTLANLISVAWMYERKDYKAAVFNGFAAGVCFMGLINVL